MKTTEGYTHCAWSKCEEQPAMKTKPQPEVKKENKFYLLWDQQCCEAIGEPAAYCDLREEIERLDGEEYDARDLVIYELTPSKLYVKQVGAFELSE